MFGMIKNKQKFDWNEKESGNKSKHNKIVIKDETQFGNIVYFLTVLG